MKVGGKELSKGWIFFRRFFFLSFKELLLSPGWQTFEFSVSFVPWQKHKLHPSHPGTELIWCTFQVLFSPQNSCVPLPQKIPRHTKLKFKGNKKRSEANLTGTTSLKQYADSIYPWLFQWSYLRIAEKSSPLRAWTAQLFMKKICKGHSQHCGSLKSPSLILPSVAVETERTAGENNSSSQSLTAFLNRSLRRFQQRIHGMKLDKQSSSVANSVLQLSS